MIIAAAFAFSPGVASAADIKSFRWRDDVGSEATASFTAAANTSISNAVGGTHRLRFGVAATAYPAFGLESTSDALDIYTSYNLLQTDGTYAYVGVHSSGSYGRIDKISLPTGSVVDSYSVAYGVSDYGLIESFIIDSTGTYGYAELAYGEGNRLIKIALSDMTLVTSVMLPNDIGTNYYYWGYELALSPLNDYVYLACANQRNDDRVALQFSTTGLVLQAHVANVVSHNEHISFLDVYSDGTLVLLTTEITDGYGSIRYYDPSDISVEAGTAISMASGTDDNSARALAIDHATDTMYVSTHTNYDSTPWNVNLLKITKSSGIPHVASIKTNPEGTQAGTLFMDGAVNAAGTVVYFADDSTSNVMGYNTSDLSIAGRSTTGVSSSDVGQIALANNKIYMGQRNEDGDINILGFSTTAVATTEDFTPRLEMGLPGWGNCSSWMQVPAVATSGEPWEMAPSANITNGGATTNVTVNGGLTDAGTFVAGQIMDMGSEAGTVTFSPGQYSEYEFSVRPTVDAGEAYYCFRLSNAGSYDNMFYTQSAAVTTGLGLGDIGFGPRQPTTANAVTLFASANDSDNVNSIELFLDGTDTGHRVHTCSYSSQTIATCSHAYGTLAVGTHTLYARYTDGLSGVSDTSSGTSIVVTAAGSDGLSNISFSPLAPTTDDVVTLSATAADADDVSSVELFLDGTDAAHRVRTCTYAPVQSSVTCTFPYGSMEAGQHTFYARYTDGASNVSSLSAGTAVGVATAVPGATRKTTQNRVILGRMQVSQSTIGRIEFSLNATVSGTLTVTFPAGFTLTGAPTSMSPCLSGATLVGRTITATKADCRGEIFLGGVGLVLPDAAGVYRVSWVNDDTGWTDVIIVSDDQLNVSAIVDPNITFDVGAASACTGSFTSSDWSVDFGRLNTGRTIASSGDSSVDLICTRLSTNATSGAVVTVRNANGASGLVSTSRPTDYIGSTAGVITSGTPRYGLCYSSVSGDSGYDNGLTPPSAAPDASQGTFGGSACTASISSGDESVAALLASPLEVWRVGGVASNAFAAMRIKVAVSATQPAHNDYSDTLTFVATATY